MKALKPLFFSLWIVGAMPAAAALAGTLSSESLHIQGVSPGTSVALIGAAREPASYISRLASYREILTDNDRDGVIQYTPPRGVAFTSMWVVVSLASGEVALLTPEGFPRVQMKQRGAGRGKAVEAIAGSLDIGRNEVAMLIVRPGEGAWTITARDGNSADRDGRANGRLRLDLSKLQRLAGAAPNPPHALKNGDVVAVLDIESMEYLVTTVGEGTK